MKCSNNHWKHFCLHNTYKLHIKNVHFYSYNTQITTTKKSIKCCKQVRCMQNSENQKIQIASISVNTNCLHKPLPQSKNLLWISSSHLTHCSLHGTFAFKTWQCMYCQLKKKQLRVTQKLRDLHCGLTWYPPRGTGCPCAASNPADTSTNSGRKSFAIGKTTVLQISLHYSHS